MHHKKEGITLIMKQILNKIMLTFAAVPVLALVASAMIAPAPAFAASGDCKDGNIGKTGLEGSAECAKGSGQSDSLTGDAGVFQTVTNVLLFIIGAIAVIMLVVGGIRYTISGGNQEQITAAKNTILYAIVGIVVAILAYAAVRFVIGSFSQS